FGPCLLLTARGSQHPLAEGDDETALFRDGDKFFRHDEAEHGMLPTNERFESKQPARPKPDERLVVEAELAALQRSAHVSLERQAARGRFDEIGGAVAAGVGPVILGLIARLVRILDARS